MNPQFAEALQRALAGSTTPTPDQPLGLGDLARPAAPVGNAQISRGPEAPAPTDPREGLKEFIRGVHLKIGHTGLPENNYLLTDAFRRSLAHAAGLIPEETNGLFEVTPEEYTPAGMAKTIEGMLEIGGGIDPDTLRAALAAADKLTAA